MSSKQVNSFREEETKSDQNFCKILNDMAGNKPSLAELRSTGNNLIKIPSDDNWLGMIGSVNPLSDITPPRFIPSETIVFPWMKHGDFILVTGMGRYCGFIEKILSSMGFLGYQERLFPNHSFHDITSVPIVRALYPCIFVVKDYQNCLDYDIVQKTETYVKYLKGKQFSLICVFEHDHPGLRKMKIWDSIIEIGYGKVHKKIYNLMQVNFLRCKTYPPIENRTFSLVNYRDPNRSGYDTTKTLYFVEKYEVLKQDIIQLFRNGRTAQEIHKILVDENKIDISLPIINKLKKRWGLRSYKPEKKPRKPKTKV